MIDQKYTLTEHISSGGMGDVYKAERIEPKHLVAVKLIGARLAQQDPATFTAALKSECAALAKMRHPNIATYIDSGTDRGQPYLVMDFIDGCHITDYCRTHGLSVRAELELFAVVCDAVQHAHDKGVTHRDLKPTNVLVAEFDQRPVPKVIDFGVASIPEQRRADTAPARTLDYTAPERVVGDQSDLYRADVYSLGVLAYELVTGTTPLGLRGLAVTDSEYAQMLDTRSIVLPSRRVARGARQGKLFWVRGDIDRVVMKALARDPAERYGTPRALAEDIRRLLKFEPLSGPTTRSHRSRLFLLRNRWAALLVTSLVVGLLGTTLALVRADAAREKEAQARENAVTLLSKNTKLLEEKEQEKRRADTNAAEARNAFTYLSVDQGARCAADGGLFEAILLFTDPLTRDAANLVAVRNARTRFKAYLSNTPHHVPTAIITHPTEIMGVEFSPDGRLLLCVGTQGARVWDCEDGHAVSQLIPAKDGAWFDAEGKRVITADGQGFGVWDLSGSSIPPPQGEPPVRVGRTALSRLKGDVRVLDFATRQPLTPPLPHESEVTRVRFSRDRKRLFTVTAGAKASSEVVRVWDAGTGQMLGPPIHCDLGIGIAEFAQDGTRVLLQHNRKEDVQGTSFRLYRVWEVTTGQDASPAHGYASTHFPSLSPDGRQILTTVDWTRTPSGPGPLCIRSVGSNHPLPTFGQTRFPAAARAEYTPDGRRIIATDYNRVLFLDPDFQDNVLASVHGMGQGVYQFGVSPDGRRVVVWPGSAFRGEKHVVVWTLLPPPAVRERNCDEGCQVVFAGQGSRVATIDPSRGVQTWDAVTGEPLTPWFGGPIEGRPWSLSNDAQRVILRDAEGNLSTWELATGKPVPPAAEEDGDRRTVVVTDNERRRLTTDTEGATVQIQNVTSGKLVTPSLKLPGKLRGATARPDGHWFLLDCEGTDVLALEAETGRLVSPQLPEGGDVSDASFTDGGNWIRFRSNDVWYVWNPERGQVVRLPGWEMEGAADGWRGSVKFSPDGTWAISFAESRFRIWDVTTGRPLTPTLSDTREPKAPRIRSVEFNSDNRRVLVVSEFSFRVWEADTGQPLTPPIPYHSHGEFIFNSTGDYVVMVFGNSVQVWPVTPDPRPDKDILLFAQLLSGHELQPSGSRTPLPPARLQEILAELRTRYPAEFLAPTGTAGR